MSRTDLTRAQKMKLLDARMNEHNDALNPEIAKLKQKDRRLLTVEEKAMLD